MSTVAAPAASAPSIPVRMSDGAVYVLPDAVVLQSVSPSPSRYLVISRKNGAVSTPSASDFMIPAAAGVTPVKICGLMGALMVPSGLCLIVATERSFVGSVNGNKIYAYTRLEAVPAGKTGIIVDVPYLTRVRAALQQGSFFSSPSYDLSHTLQHNLDGVSQRSGPHEAFFWNKYLASVFSKDIQDFWVLPMIRGFVSWSAVHAFDGTKIQFVLISRQAPHRAGTRYYRRGIDVKTAHVANFTETEQIVEFSQGGRMESLVQVRGSIPLQWSQKPNICYKPKPVLGDNVRGMTDACARHMQYLQSNYSGHVTCVDLVNQSGSEGKLAKEYQRCVSVVAKQRNIDVEYIGFDFHKECAKMRYERLGKLVDKVRPQIERSVFSTSGQQQQPPQQPQPPQQQQQQQQQQLSSSVHGVIRTNCIDCLDRTNVTQAQFARTRLEKYLDKDPKFDQVFKHAWADNADAISRLYAGTGALKTDFTRTGIRSHRGTLQDGVNSLMRYYRNNFSDGVRQDGVDLLVGTVQLKKGQLPLKMAMSSDLGRMWLALLLICVLGMIFVSPLIFLSAIVLLIVLGVSLPRIFVNLPLLNGDAGDVVLHGGSGVDGTTTGAKRD